MLDPDPASIQRYLVRAGEMICLCPGTWVDVAAFERAAERARRRREPSAYHEALVLYDGDLLPEDQYEDWVVEPARMLRDEHVALLVEVTELFEARGELDAAVGTARRAAAADPLCEPAHVALMRLYALSGRRAEALGEYDLLRSSLRNELGTEPSVGSQRLYAQIKAGRPVDAELAGAVWEQIGDLRTISGDAVGAVTAYEEAAAAVPRGSQGHAALVRLHRKASQACLVEMDPRSARRHLETATRLAAHVRDRAERGRLANAQATWLWQVGRFEEAQRAAEHSLRLATEHGVPDDVAAANETLAIVFHFRGAWRDGLQVEIERLGAQVDRVPQVARVFDIHHCIAQFHLYSDALFSSVEEYARGTLELATRVGAVRAQAFAWCLLGEALLLEGHWDESAACLERCAQMQEQFGTRTCGLVWQRLGELAVGRGDSTDASAYVRRGMAVAAVSPMSRHIWGRLYATLAFDAVERGEPAAAIRAVRGATAAAARYGDCPSCSALINPIAAEAYAAFGDSAEAEVHARAAEQIAGSFQSSAWRAMAQTAWGALALAADDATAARARFLAAARLYAQAGQPFWVARSRAQAALVGVGGDADEEALRAAESTFIELGAVRAAARVRSAR